MKKVFIFISFLLLTVPSLAHAILPPNIIFSIGTQVYEIFAVIGVLISGALVSIAPFLGRLKEKYNNAHSTWVIVGSFFLILAFAGFVYTYYFIRTSLEHPIVIPNGVSTSTVGYRYYSDRFVIAINTVGGASDQKPTLIDLILSRKENNASGFTHYYLANVISEGKSGKFYVERESVSEPVLPDLFFKSYSKQEASDHSSREKYMFTFNILGKTYSVDTGELSSDFITKNDPIFTSYVSAGTAHLMVNGKPVDAPVLHQGIYSDDYRPTIFFDEAVKIRSNTIQLILWDEKSDFYLVDESHVFDFTPGYASHIWSLMKDANGYTKKSFSGNVYKEAKNGATSFYASIPDFKNAELQTKLITEFNKDKEKGFVEGTVTDTDGTRQVYGLGYYNEYGQNDGE